MPIIQETVHIDKGRIPLSTFENWRRIIPVFEIKAKSSFTPIDLNLFSSSKQPSWTQADRLRFWLAELSDSKSFLPHLTIRKIDLESDALCHCSISVEGEVRILGNDKEFTENFFRETFTEVPPSLPTKKRWKVQKGWARTKASTIMLAAHIAGALGWRNMVPSDIIESWGEAADGYKSKNWLSCLVMCRRAAESIVKFAYLRCFGRDPRGLDMNAILRRFEAQEPALIPKHWISLLDSVRYVGNVPGAHAQSSIRYKVGKIDARTALRNVRAFKAAYFSKIDPNLSHP